MRSILCKKTWWYLAKWARFSCADHFPGTFTTESVSVETSRRVSARKSCNWVSQRWRRVELALFIGRLSVSVCKVDEENAAEGGCGPCSFCGLPDYAPR